MDRSRPKHRYSVGELVAAAYREAGRTTRDRRLAAVIANRILTSWLARSDHPELVHQLGLPGT